MFSDADQFIYWGIYFLDLGVDSFPVSKFQSGFGYCVFLLQAVLIISASENPLLVDL